VSGRPIVLVVGAVALLAAACGDEAGPRASQTRSPSPISTISPAASDPAAIDDCLDRSVQIVEFATSDGAPLVGAVVGSGSNGVVLAHELNSNLCAWFPFANRLASAGYRVLAFDMRGFGASGFAPGGRYDLDVLGAVEKLQELGVSRVALMGASLGATAVLTAAPQVGETLTGLASLSGPSSYGGLDAEEAVAELDVPMLFVAARGDGRFPQDARDLYRAAPDELATLKLLRGFDHGTNLLRFELAKTTRDLVLSYLRDAFAGPEEHQPSSSGSPGGG
jgi:pimeloyl-ACP methyl ester carboxylesterase